MTLKLGLLGCMTSLKYCPDTHNISLYTTIIHSVSGGRYSTTLVNWEAVRCRHKRLEFHEDEFHTQHLFLGGSFGKFECLLPHV